MKTKKPASPPPALLSEEGCRQKWEHEKTYCYNENPPPDQKPFVIDTPPPTLSGTLHIGHIFSYTQTDILARFQRMRGRNVFYPMGWDNNGLPTEKRVSQLYHIVCRPDLSPEEQLKQFSVSQKFSGNQFSPSELKQKFLNHIHGRRGLFLQNKKKQGGPPLAISRGSFVSLCRRQTEEDQKDYKTLWQRMALSIDWRYTYETISPFCQALSQRSFLDLYQKGYVENRFSPVYWDTQFQTAVAQADIEDREREGFYHNIVFQLLGQGSQKQGPSLVISTTRPELLPACVALVAHPGDERYRKFFNRQALSPLFQAPVPVLPSEHADPEKGTGLLMVCTFGDREDVEFWKKTRRAGQTPLPLRSVTGWDGKIRTLKRGWLPPLKSLKPEGTDGKDFDEGQEEFFFSLNPARARDFYSRLEGLSVFQARDQVVKLLRQERALRGEPQPTRQFVKFYEKGSRALELLPTRQWYIKLLEHKQDFLRQGKKIQWHPPSMFKRYEQWVEGLNEDWCISRQRFFGVPFPLWYPVTPEGRVEGTRPLFAPPGACAVDPLSRAPADVIKGSPYTENLRDKPGGFTALHQVMDTWATSSLSPQINSHWGTDSQRHKKLFPADLRPQAHEIIRTWAFYTIVKSFFHERKIPWRKTAISGWVMDPRRLKMSKSRGQALLPEELLKKYPADALRYWAGRAGLGQDTVYDEDRVRTGRKLVVKLTNAVRFVQMLFPRPRGMAKNNLNFKTTWLDRAWLHELWKTHQRAGDLLENFHHSEALNVVEKHFWLFCDNYIELVKPRGYRMSDKPEGLSALHTLDFSCYLFLKMFAPFLPYVTEQLWQERYKGDSPCVHGSSWERCFLEKGNEFHRLKGEALSFEGDFRACLLSGGEGDRVLKESAGSLSRALMNMAFEILREVRSEKSSRSLGLSTPLKGLKIYGSLGHKVLFEFLRGDVALSARGGGSEEVVFALHPTGELKVQITL